MGKKDYNHEQETVDKIFNGSSIFWDATYEANDTHGMTIRKRLAAALSYIDELPLPRNARILEIGCGAGLWQQLLPGEDLLLRHWTMPPK